MSSNLAINNQEVAFCPCLLYSLSYFSTHTIKPGMGEVEFIARPISLTLILPLSFPFYNLLDCIPQSLDIYKSKDDFSTNEGNSFEDNIMLLF